MVSRIFLCWEFMNKSVDLGSDQYLYRIGYGCWINDLRNQALMHKDWPCCVLDHQLLSDIEGSIKLQASAGFNGLALWGLVGRYWDTPLQKGVDAERCERIEAIVEMAERYGLHLYCGLGLK